MKKTKRHIFAPILMMSFLAHADEVPQITVTATKEAESTDSQAVTTDAVNEKTIKAIRPAHPSEIMDRIPGVHVNVTGGEGHMTAIRQPLTTNPVYLYLEDGLPTRSPGFFNHNALYEVNVPQAGGIEVLKGPGTSLYGSDAIGGVINVLTRPVPVGSEASVDMEAGGYGWKRLLLDGGKGDENGGHRQELNLTHSDGWRDATNYDRQGYTGRWESLTGSGAMLKTVLSMSNIDQQTAGSSAISLDDYLNNPEINYTPISYRRVQALRLSTEYSREEASHMLTITPYLRSNNMDILPNWSLSYDPTVYSSGHNSLGVQIRNRSDLDNRKLKLITGMDVEYSPGYHKEYSITTTKTGSIYTDYAIDQLIYDYAVAFSEISPYLHAEYQSTDKLRFEAGLRYDMMQYDYDNHLSTVTSGSHQRPGDTAISYQHPSPKIGLVYAFNAHHNGYLSYRHAFRVPSEGQLFRQGSAVDTVNLKPVKTDNIEMGLRGRAWQGARYQLAIYDMVKTDDILTYDDGTTKYSTNAGQTRHQGVELGMHIKHSERLSTTIAYSYARHLLVDWTPKAGVDYSGNEMSSAPNVIADINIAYRPESLNGGEVAVEWKHLGEYWMDDANTHTYPGHSVVNLRSEYRFSKAARLQLRIINLLNARYATRATYNAFRGEEYAPGMPRNLYLGYEYEL